MELIIIGLIAIAVLVAVIIRAMSWASNVNDRLNAMDISMDARRKDVADLDKQFWNQYNMLSSLGKSLDLEYVNQGEQWVKKSKCKKF